VSLCISSEAAMTEIARRRCTVNVDRCRAYQALSERRTLSEVDQWSHGQPQRGGALLQTCESLELGLRVLPNLTSALLSKRGRSERQPWAGILRAYVGVQEEHDGECLGGCILQSSIIL
jgi:hypothetical protein